MTFKVLKDHIKRHILPNAFFIIYFILMMIGRQTYALIPLESLILGDLPLEQRFSDNGALDYIFKDFELEKKVRGRREYYTRPGMERLGVYRGFFEEGENLDNKCSSAPKVEYASTSELIDAKRTYLASVQYLGLEVLASFLASYSHYFDFTQDEYGNLIDNLVGNYCSKNMTIISTRQLKLNLKERFNKDRQMSLPSIENDLRFEKSLANFGEHHSARKREFHWSLELFKSVCSWSNDTDNYGLLIPLLRSPVLSAALIRKISGQTLRYDSLNNQVVKYKTNKRLSVSCQNLICRRVDNTTFDDRMPRAIGTTSLRSDLERLYCTEFRDADYQRDFQPPKIEKIIKSITFDERNLMVSQMIAMMTGHPDFLVQSERFNSLSNIMRAGVDSVWDSWATKQNEGFEDTLTFEESLVIEAVPSEYYFINSRPKFSVQLDINMGEFDQVNAMVGKISSTIKLKFSKKFLSWARRIWKEVDPKTDLKKVKRVMLPFEKMVEDKLKEHFEVFESLPKSSQVTHLVGRELLTQLVQYDGDYFEGSNTGLVEVPVNFNYGSFALRHLYYRYRIRKNEGVVTSELEKLRDIKIQ